MTLPTNLARLLIGTVAAVLVVGSGSGCRPGPDRVRPSHVDDGATPSSPPSAPSDGSGTVPAGPPNDGSADGSAVADESAPPTVHLEAQSCVAHDDCRVIQPGDWNPRVECCYEYSCDLDYVAVNLETWARIRDWQRANPFECTAHLRESGPCTPRAPRCGLVQDAPAPACIDGLCAVAFPRPWPVVDPAAQRCSSQAECVAFRPASSSPESRCCGGACEGDWIAVSRATAQELDRWRNHHAPSCDAWRDEHACPAAAPCNLVPPPVTCRGGECVVDDLQPAGVER